jgi:hypothetical protein
MGVIDSLPVWLVFLLTSLWIGLALEIGYRLGSRKAKAGEKKGDGAAAMVGATMGLLAFMLAFTFNWSSNRHDARRATVTKEASAISVAYTRANFLPDEDRKLAQSALRGYVDVRLKAASEEISLQEAMPESERLHKELIDIALRAPRTEGSAVLTALFMQSVNDIVAVHMERLAVGVRQRVAPTIWFILYGLALVGMLMTGALIGISQVRQVGFEMAFAVAFAMVLFLIVDLDRPHEGLVNVSQTAMSELRDRLAAQ